MSIFGAMYTGVTGMAANSQTLGIISDNIANVNTVGYKETAGRFSTLVTEPSTRTRYTSGGVQSMPRTMIDRQGLLQTSASPTDLAISGDGFFVVDTTTNPQSLDNEHLFTRAGSFRTDMNGFLVNDAGLYLVGWPVASDGSLPLNPDLNSLNPINVGQLTGTAEPSTAIRLKANLQASEVAHAGAYAAGDLTTGAVAPHFERSMPVYDAQGGVRVLTLSLLKTGANTWQGEIHGAPSDLDTAVHPNGLIASGSLIFGADGSLDPASTLPSTLNTTWTPTAGLGSQSIALNYGTPGGADGFTQFDSPSTLISSTIDGAVFSGVGSVEVDKAGSVTAIFSNGVRREIATIPLATFPNPNGLGSRSGNAYVRSADSGPVSLSIPGTSGAGDIAANALEGSTVDLAEQFTNLITTQRAYSANSRVISTANEMLDDVIRIIR